MVDDDNIGPRSRYYDAVLRILDNDIAPELKSARATYSYTFVRKLLSRLAAVSDHLPVYPENLAALHAEAMAIDCMPESRDELYAALQEEGRLMDAMESATDERMKPRSKAAETATALPETITVASVQAYLRARLDPTTTVSKLQVLSGGRSKQTILFTMTDADGKEIERVIRRDLTSSPTGGTVPEEYALLAALADRGLPVPRPVLCEPDASKLGSPFIIVEKIAGGLAGHAFDPPNRAATLDSARVLGQLHALPAAEIAPAIKERSRVAPDAAKIRELVLDLKKSWDENARAYSVTIDYVFAWLLDNIKNLHPLTTVVHADYSYHNLMFDGDRLSAVLDWELVRIGHPAEDLGYIRPAVLKRMPWEDFMAAYHAGGGPAINHKDVVFYTLLEKMRLTAMMFRVRGYLESGFTDDIELAYAFAVSVPRTIHQASTEIRAVLGIADLPGPVL